MPSEAPCATPAALPLKPKLVLKIAPDLDDSELAAIAVVVRSSGVDGVIVSNTTVRRPKDLSDRTFFFFAPCALTLIWFLDCCVLSHLLFCYETHHYHMDIQRTRSRPVGCLGHP